MIVYCELSTVLGALQMTLTKSNKYPAKYLTLQATIFSWRKLSPRLGNPPKVTLQQKKEMELGFS